MSAEKLTRTKVAEIIGRALDHGDVEEALQEAGHDYRIDMSDWNSPEGIIRVSGFEVDDEDSGIEIELQVIGVSTAWGLIDFRQDPDRSR